MSLFHKILIIFFVSIFNSCFFVFSVQEMKECIPPRAQSGRELVKKSWALSDGQSHQNESYVSIQPCYPADLFLEPGVPNIAYLRYLEYLVETSDKDLLQALFMGKDRVVFKDAVLSREKTTRMLFWGKVIGNLVLFALCSMAFYSDIDPYKIFLISLFINVIIYNVPFYATGDQPNIASNKGDEAQARFDYLQEIFTIASRNLGYFFKFGKESEKELVKKIVLKFLDQECLEKLSFVFKNVTQRENGNILLTDVKHMAEEISYVIRMRGLPRALSLEELALHHRGGGIVVPSPLGGGRSSSRVGQPASGVSEVFRPLSGLGDSAYFALFYERQAD